jgi:hypothetical protein
VNLYKKRDQIAPHLVIAGVSVRKREKRRKKDRKKRKKERRKKKEKKKVRRGRGKKNRILR